jgi:hypothetical protein
MKRALPETSRFLWFFILAAVGTVLLPVSAAFGGTQQIAQVSKVCRESGRQRPDTSCSNCHTSVGQSTLSENGERFKSNISGNQDWVLTNFCPLRAAGGGTSRAKPVLIVQDPMTLVANAGTVSFSVTDPQGARLKLKVLGQPKGMLLQQTKASGSTYNGTLYWPKNAKPAVPGSYRLTLSATQVSGSPRLTATTGMTLVVVRPSP